MTASAYLHRLRATGRALVALMLGGLAVVGAIAAFRQGLLPVVETTFQLSPETLSIVRRLGITVSAIGAYWAYVHWYERRRATELALRPLPLLLGAGAGVALVALPLALLFALGAYEVVGTRMPTPPLAGVVALIGIAAMLEELFYRCLLFRILERAWGLWPALGVQAAVFAAAHLGNVQAGNAVDAATMLLSVSALGLLWGGIYAMTRNLWVVSAHHAAWNFTILCSGVPLSGIEDWRALAPLESRYVGADWLTGGLFGPESSALVIVTVLLALVIVMRRAHRAATAGG